MSLPSWSLSQILGQLNSRIIGRLAIGGRGSDGIYGNDLINDLYGGEGNDDIYGQRGSDLIFGGGRSDFIDGDAGDCIILSKTSIDKIDLSDIYANTYLSGNQAFTYIVAYAFYGVSGQSRYAASVFSGDVNGDRIADFQIEVAALGTVNDIVL